VAFGFRLGELEEMTLGEAKHWWMIGWNRELRAAGTTE
jgi:hypothetical protein